MKTIDENMESLLLYMDIRHVTVLLSAEMSHASKYPCIISKRVLSVNNQLDDTLDR